MEYDEIGISDPRPWIRELTNYYEITYLYNRCAEVDEFIEAIGELASSYVAAFEMNYVDYKKKVW